jgi:hypothetical protein
MTAAGADRAPGHGSSQAKEVPMPSLSSCRWSFVLLAIVPALGAQEVQEDLRLSSRRFGTRTGPDESTSVVSLGSRREARLALDAHDSSPVFGPGDVYALVDRLAREDAVRILDLEHQVLSRFTVPGDRTLQLGTRSLALRPRSDHGVGTAFDVEFRDLSGKTTGRAASESSSLTAVESAPSGHWILHSVDRSGEAHVHLFDARGVQLWEHRTGRSGTPAVGVSASGDRAAIGVLQDDRVHSSLAVLDATGAVVATGVVPAFRLALFDPAGAHLALAGGQTVSFVRVRGAEVVWSRTEDRALALGWSLAFAPDGSELCALTVERDPEAAPEPPRLVRYTNLGGPVTAASRTIEGLPSDPYLWVLELWEADEGWRIATQAGLWRL